jgi:two-component system, NtrC family, response regulator AlgB
MGAAGNGLRVLVVDDEKNIRTTLGMCIEGMGCPVVAVGTPEAALAALARQPFDLAFVDLRLADQSGLDLLPKLLGAAPGLAIVVITAWATVDTAVEAIRRGARDYLPKPFSPGQIRRVVDQMVERRAIDRRLATLERELADAAAAVEPHTGSPRMRALLEQVARAASSEAPVLFRGENGTGKSVLARALHARSPRAEGPFVVVNCPTLSEELLASELFGHVRGAFTGATRDQPGRVEAAEGGTLFLDEIGELPPSLQAKLLRFLQDKCFERLGESKTRQADVRVIAATNRDVDADVRSGRFREDLLYRLNVVEIAVPPLRERPEDILGLARLFLAAAARAARRPPLELATATEKLLVQYAWPGNLRELRNVIERVAILWPSTIVPPEALPERLRGDGAPAVPRIGGDFTLDQVELEHLLRVVERTATREEAARILGIDVSTLWRKLKKIG